MLSNGRQSVLPEPLSEAKTWVVWIGVEPDHEPARAAFAKTSTASTTTMANASLVVRHERRSRCDPYGGRCFGGVECVDEVA